MRQWNRLRVMPGRIAFSIAIGLASWPALANQPPLSEALQKEALTCAMEAVQICPDVWTSEDHGLACMTGKRSQFSARCQVIYDKVDKALHAKTRVRSASHHTGIRRVAR